MEESTKSKIVNKGIGQKGGIPHCCATCKYANTHNLIYWNICCMYNYTYPEVHSADGICNKYTIKI